MTRLDDRARAFILQYFNASPGRIRSHFHCECQRRAEVGGRSLPVCGGRTLPAHLRQPQLGQRHPRIRARAGAAITYVPVNPPEMRIDAKNCGFLEQAQPGAHNLFAYPAQSNFSGVQHDLEWIDRAQPKGWDVLLDAAAFAPTNRLDLSAVHPDFVCLSFYKMFGYPTGVGALLARRGALAKLHRPWFAGGTITVASVQGDRYFLHLGAEGFEDGTLNYLTLPAVEIGLRHIAG